MKITIDLAHQKYFKANGYIQFEEVFNSEQTRAINLEVNQVLAKRGDPNHSAPTAQAFFQKGRDVWRSSDHLNKHLNHRNLAGIASELVDYKPLRLGYDQYLLPPLPYPTEHSLEQISCIQGIMCGVLICLVNAETVIPNEIFPTKAGDATFFDANYDFPWDQMAALKDEAFLLIAYTGERALYVHQENDLHKYSLKEFGYNFGDRLTDQWHPIVYR